MNMKNVEMGINVGNVVNMINAEVWKCVRT